MTGLDSSLHRRMNMSPTNAAVVPLLLLLSPEFLPRIPRADAFLLLPHPNHLCALHLPRHLVGLSQFDAGAGCRRRPNGASTARDGSALLQHAAQQQQRRRRSLLFRLAGAPEDSNAEAAESTTDPIASSSSSMRAVLDWYVSEPLESLLPRTDAVAVASELLSDDALIDSSEELLSKYWDKLETKLRDETRPVRDLLGNDVADRALRSVQSLNQYDPDAVRAFLGSDAVNALFARVLYDGISEFFQKIDVFGNIVGSLPVIGPIRNQIATEARKSVDRTLGPLVQSFLRTYTRIAVLEAVEFVLSPSNRKSFGDANVKLVSSLLDRPVESLLPPSETTRKLRDDLYAYLRNADVKDVDRYVGYAYDLLEDKSVDGFVDVDRVLDASPTLTKTLESLWERAQQASEGGGKD